MLASKAKWSVRLCLCMALFSHSSAWSQGCSDSGFCTMGAMSPNQGYSKRSDVKVRSLAIEYYRAKSTLSPVIHAATLALDLSIGPKHMVQIKVPHQWVKGRLGSTQGWGDISLSVTRNLLKKRNFDINATLGTRIPTNGSRKSNVRGNELPMYYQTSLGSFDIIAGVSFINRKWLLALGYQQALTKNANGFQHEEWEVFPDTNYLLEYPLATALKRGKDIMLRVERNFRFSNFGFHVGLLPIYRINKDRIFSQMEMKYIPVDETTGLALSGLAGIEYRFNAHRSMHFIYGRKITQRKVNPDGLTRHDLITLSYKQNF